MNNTVKYIAKTATQILASTAIYNGTHRLADQIFGDKRGILKYATEMAVSIVVCKKSNKLIDQLFNQIFGMKGV